MENNTNEFSFNDIVKTSNKHRKTPTKYITISTMLANKFDIKEGDFVTVVIVKYNNITRK